MEPWYDVMQTSYPFGYGIPRYGLHEQENEVTGKMADKSIWKKALGFFGECEDAVKPVKEVLASRDTRLAAIQQAFALGGRAAR